ncbi:ACP S-malonyltransferase [Alicyclobacillus shizuokensis]|uniref:ACP S-malonyltransferase n=1 Tax=Alicyclobacillus shizuokensis TaxID=392014 RepID=UPI000AF30B09|nr:ACP S-malonyltransferase [Alicyclobacillus shizuokensis]
MEWAFVFPGQGAQYVGMGQELMDRYPIAAETFREADEALEFSLTNLCREGPAEQLRLTYYTQPALLTMGVAAYRVFAAECPLRPAAVAGHSLGEYTALVAAGALSFADAVRLVHLRGRWMDEAVPAGHGAMAAVLGLSESELDSVCREVSSSGEVVELANLNCPGQIVISGTRAGVDAAGRLAKERGARRVLPLEVSGPFHCSLMRPAASKLSTELAKTAIQDAQVPVVTNVDAQPVTKQEDLRHALERQLCSPVRFEADVRRMLDIGVQGFIEFGPGTVLSGLIRKVQRTAVTQHVEDEASLRASLSAVKECE